MILLETALADPAVLAAVIAAAAAVLGPPITWIITRRRVDAATVELTEAQAEQLRTQVWTQLSETLQAEVVRLQGRITELETRLAAHDRALREQGAELAAVRADRDQLQGRLADAYAQLQERDRQIAQLQGVITGLRGSATTT